MASNLSGSSSGFAAAARVLFDSAKKVGAVKPLGTTDRLYAQQLKKIQTQSRKKGGSLGSVSYNVAEFLEAHRTKQNKPVHVPVLHTKRVPLIDIPWKQTEKKRLSSQRILPRDVPDLDFQRNLHHHTKQSDSSRQVAKADGNPEVACSLTVLVVPGLCHSPAPKVCDEKQPQCQSEVTAATSHLAAAEGDEVVVPACSIESETTKVTVVEERPLFEASHTTGSKTLPLLNLVARQPAVREAGVPGKHVKPAITVPISPRGSSAVVAPRLEITQSDTISVDVWELQRERELERLRRDQEAVERERLEARRGKEYEALGDEWVSSRTVAVSQSLYANVVDSALENLYFSSNWEACFRCFKQLMSTTAPPTTLISRQAVRLAEKHLRYVPDAYRDGVKTALSKELTDRKLHDEAVRFDLRHNHADAFLETYRSVPSAIKDSLDFSTTAKAISVLARRGSWQEAIEVLHKSQRRFSDRSGFLGLRLLAGCRKLDCEAKAAVSEYTSKVLSNQGRLGKLHSIELARLATGAQKRHILSQLISSSHMDEVVYAEFLRTTKESVGDVLQEMGKKGLNVEDPAVMMAQCWRSFDVENPRALFHEIERQEIITGVRPFHVLVIVAMARMAKTEQVLRFAIQIAKKRPDFRCKFVLRKLLPLLHEKGMNDDIVELAEIYANHVPLAVALPQAVGFINSALIAQGKLPLSGHLASDLNGVRKTVLGGPDFAAQLSPPGESKTAVSTGAMLQCVKERDWVRALGLLDEFSLRSAKDPDVGMLSVMYNCALNASVEKREVVAALYRRMIDKGVPVNATTSNALLSCFISCSQWEEGIQFYEKTNSSLRDSGTYCIMLSVLGKNGMWKEACEVFQDARAGLVEITPTIFRLGIMAAHEHNWEVTLGIFDRFLKEHGSRNIGNSVIDKVVQCLSCNGRASELKKVEIEVSRVKGKTKDKR